MSLDALIPNKAQLARDLNLSSNTVYRWVKNNAIPPRHVIHVANALDVEIPVLLPYAQRTYERTYTQRKGLDDLEILLAAYEKRPFERPPHLSEQSLKVTLGHWKGKLPLMVEVLRKVAAESMSREAAATLLEVSPHTLKGLLHRYSAVPVKPKREPKPKGRVTLNRDKAPAALNDVISGRRSAAAAARHYNLNLRTLHRHIQNVLPPQSLNEISHWSRSFRSALAWEVQTKHTRLTAEWRKMAEEQRLVLPKKPKFPRLPMNLRETSVKQLILHWLLDEISIEELTRLRGGSEEVWRNLFSTELHNNGIFGLPSIHHKAAAAEVLLAKMSHFRSRPAIRAVAAESGEARRDQ